MASKNKAAPTLKARIMRAAHLSYIANMTDAEIASEMEVSTSTIANWKTRPEWLEALHEVAMDAWGESMHRLKGCTNKATRALEDMLEHEDYRIRLRAATVLLQYGMPSSV